MSFRAEVASFLGAAEKFHDMGRKDKDSDTKNNYYNALIQNQQATQSLNEKKLASSEKMARDRLGIQREQLGQQNSFRKAQLGMAGRAQDRADKFNDWRMSGAPPGARATRAAPGALDTGDGTTSRLFNGQGGTGAVPTTGAVPFTGVSGNDNPYAANAQGDDEEDVVGDETPQPVMDDEEQDFAAGGAVGEPLDRRRPGAVSDDQEEPPLPTVQGVNAERDRRRTEAAAPAPGTATKTSGGFDLASTLAGWGANAASVGADSGSARDVNAGRAASMSPATRQPPPAYGVPPNEEPEAAPAVTEDEFSAPKPKPTEPAPNGVGSDYVSGRSPKGALDIEEAGAVPADPAPAPAPAAASKKSAVDASGAGAPVPTKANPEAGFNPVALGAKGLMETYKLGDQKGVDVDGNHKRLANHEGAYSDEEIKAINKAVDPNGELSESARVIARLDAGVKYHLARGDQKKAAEMAKSLLAYGGLQASKFGAAAARAMQVGKNDEAAKYIALGLDQVPDGRSIGVAADKNGAFHATAKDPQTGEVHDLGNFDTAQVMKLALGLQSGQEFYTRVAQIAGGNFGKSVTNQGNKPAPGEKIAPLANRERATKMIDSVTDKFKPTEGADPRHFEEAKSIASQMLHTNNIDPTNAMRFVGMMTDIKQQPQAKVIQKDGGGVLVEWQGQQLKLSTNMIAQIGLLRKSQEEAAAAASEKTKHEQGVKDKAAKEASKFNQPAPGRAPVIRWKKPVNPASES